MTGTGIFPLTKIIKISIYVLTALSAPLLFLVKGRDRRKKEEEGADDEGEKNDSGGGDVDGR